MEKFCDPFLHVVLVSLNSPPKSGKDGDEAAEEIQQENPDIKKVEIIRPGEASTADYREDRVRINVDENNKVVSAPQIG